MKVAREELLEAGFVLLSVGFVAGFGLLVGGRLLEKLRQEPGPVPPSGSVSGERHQHLAPSPR